IAAKSSSMEPDLVSGAPDSALPAMEKAVLSREFVVGSIPIHFRHLGEVARHKTSLQESHVQHLPCLVTAKSGLVQLAHGLARTAGRGSAPPWCLRPGVVVQPVGACLADLSLEPVASAPDRSLAARLVYALRPLAVLRPGTDHTPQPFHALPVLHLLRPDPPD